MRICRSFSRNRTFHITTNSNRHGRSFSYKFNRRAMADEAPPAADPPQELSNPETTPPTPSQSSTTPPPLDPAAEGSEDVDPAAEMEAEIKTLEAPTIQELDLALGEIFIPVLNFAKAQGGFNRVKGGAVEEFMASAWGGGREGGS
jgi:hypothetical protein